MKKSNYKSRSIFIQTVLWLTITVVGHSQVLNLGALDSLYTHYQNSISNKTLAGVESLLIVNDRVVWHQAQGYQDVSTEKVLEPKNLQINLDLCKKTLLDSWEALQMRAGAGAPPPPSFEDYVISYMGEIIADATEESIWEGTAVAGKFNGFLGAATGYLLPGVDATVIQSSASAAYDASNIIANLQTLTADMAANISPILKAGSSF